jgi:hypothetical protein
MLMRPLYAMFVKSLCVLVVVFVLSQKRTWKVFSLAVWGSKQTRRTGHLVGRVRVAPRPHAISPSTNMHSFFAIVKKSR